jgi:CRP-like cAMP-binding protein
VAPVTVAYISRHHFDTLLANDPSVRDAVIRVLHDRSAVPDGSPPDR